MTELQVRQKAFLDETVAHFNINNRATENEWSCEYKHKYNGGCAIGRKVSAELADKLSGPVGLCFKLLPMDLQELTQQFLAQVQRLHDRSVFWNENGLSEEGKLRYADVCKEFELV